MTKEAKPQVAGSQRGPKELDAARKNLGGAADADLDIDDDEPQALPGGQTASKDEQDQPTGRPAPPRP